MSNRNYRFMMCLSDIQDCSWMDSIFSNSIVGRHVYHFLERSYYYDRLGLDYQKFIKQAIPSANFTDRAIRFKLSELESNGYVFRLRADGDSRGKIVRPTEKLVKLVETQKMRCESIIGKNFMIVEK